MKLRSALRSCFVVAAGLPAAGCLSDRTVASEAPLSSASPLVREVRLRCPACDHAITAALGRSVDRSDGLSTLRVRRSSGDVISAQVPSSPTTPMRVQAAGLSIGVRRVGATGSTAQWQGGVAAFPNAAPGIDALLYDDGEAIEELLVARSASAVMAYELHLPRGTVAIPADPSTVVIRSGGLPALRMVASAAWDADGRKIVPRLELQGNRVTVRLPADVAWPVVVDPTWESTRFMQSKRAMHAAALLPSGKILIAGGCTTYRCSEGIDAGDGGVIETPTTIATAELYDPGSGTFEPTGAMKTARHSFTLTTMPSGKVVAIGGCDDTDACTSPTPSIEVYDPETGTFVVAGLNSSRAEHTATRLADGRVLLFGGAQGSTSVAEYLQDEGGFFVLAQMPGGIARKRHTATLLSDGRVLVAGGVDDQVVLSGTQLFDPGSYAIADGPAMTIPRMEHSATATFDPVKVAEGTSLAGGAVLVTGGCTTSNCSSGPTKIAELFDLTTSKFVAMTLPGSSMQVKRRQHSSVLLADGRVLTMLGCTDSGGNGGCWTEQLPDSADLFDPATGAFSDALIPVALRRHFTATVLATGRVLVAGGNGSGLAHRAAELFDPTGYDPMVTDPLLPGGPAGEAQAPAATMTYSRALHTATLLRDGRVLIVGGVRCVDPNNVDCFFGVQKSELYDFRSETVVATGNAKAFRIGHRASLLLDGRVLISGGCLTPKCNEAPLPVTVNDSLELYDPATGEFSLSAAKMSESRGGHTSTVLPDGRVLLTGGCITATCVAPPYRSSVDIYDPETDALEALPPMSRARAEHTATLLPSGKVMIVGGRDASGTVAESELIDPVSKTVTQVPRPFEARAGHAAVLMPGGAVLLAAGSSESGLTTLTRSAEYYSESGASLLLPLLKQGHFWSEQGGVRLLSGKLLMFGGSTLLTELATGTGSGEDTPQEQGVDLFDPLAGFGTGVFAYSRRLPTPLGGNTATRLPSGRIALIGGCNVDPATMCKGEINKQILSYGDGMLSGTWRPTIDSSPVQFKIGGLAELKGTGFLGRPGGGSGSTSSSDSAHPVALWFPDSGGPPVSGELVDWTSTTAKWRVPRTSERGSGWLHVVVQGVPSLGVSVILQPAATGEPCRLGPECASGFCVDEVCCESACDQPCLTCSADKKASGADGLCEPVAQEYDPDDDCTMEPVVTCGRDGTCDGKGKCARYGAGMPCSAPSCAQDVETPASACNGDGACVAVPSRACSPSRCDALGVACIIACKSASDCADSAACVQGTCTIVLDDGASCTSDAVCKSGACINGSCCTVSHCAPYACSGSGCSVTCDDDDECAPGARCDVPTRHCKADAACADDRTAVSVDGKKTSCAPFLCSDGLCITRCNATEQCVTGNVCDRTTGLCVAPEQATVESPGCGCATPRGSTSRTGGVLIAAACLTLLRRRRRY